jgi:hypothetical protein
MINMDQYKPRLFWELKFLEIYFQGQVPLFKGDLGGSTWVIKNYGFQVRRGLVYIQALLYAEN